MTLGILDERWDFEMRSTAACGKPLRYTTRALILCGVLYCTVCYPRDTRFADQEVDERWDFEAAHLQESCPQPGHGGSHCNHYGDTDTACCYCGAVAPDEGGEA